MLMSISRMDYDTSGPGGDFEAVAADVPSVQSWTFGRTYNLQRSQCGCGYEVRVSTTDSLLILSSYGVL